MASIITLQDIILRLLLATLLGGLIGLERQIKHHPVGMRTNVLVCISAATVMILSDLTTYQSFLLYGSAIDPRFGAQLISGIGFLGAGTIMHANSTVKGLTTAASLFSVACIGLAIGAGYYELAIVSFTIVLTVLFLLNGLTKKFSRNLSIRQGIITSQADANTASEIYEVLRKSKVETQEIETVFPHNKMDTKATFTFPTTTIAQRELILHGMQNIEGIIEIKL